VNSDRELGWYFIKIVRASSRLFAAQILTFIRLWLIAFSFTFLSAYG